MADSDASTVLHKVSPGFGGLIVGVSTLAGLLVLYSLWCLATRWVVSGGPFAFRRSRGDEEVQRREVEIAEYLVVMRWRTLDPSAAKGMDKSVSATSLTTSTCEPGQEHPAVGENLDLSGSEIMRRCDLQQLQQESFSTFEDSIETKSVGEDEFKSLSKDSDCAICLSPYLENDVVCSSHNESCNHIFHLSCMTAWLSKHSLCPVCRQPYIFDSKDKLPESEAA